MTGDFAVAEALILLFYCAFLGPVVVLAAVIVVLTALGLLSEAIAPAARALSLPRWTAMTLVLLAVTGVVYAERARWLPSSLWAVHIVVQAWRTVVS
jgi:hypothetical protein